MEKWKRLLQEAQAAAKAARDIAAKADAESRDLTDDERAEFEAKTKEAIETKAASDQAKKDADTQAKLADLAGDRGDEAPGDDGGSDLSGSLAAFDRHAKASALAFGDRFVKSDAYEAFRKEHASGVGQGTPINIGRVKVGTMEEWYGGRKTVTLPQARVQDIRMPLVDLVDRDRLTLLDLISRGQTNGNFEYVQVTAVERNADIVPESDDTFVADEDLKPVSEISTALADAKVFTYADGYDVTNQLLADAPAFATYMNNELRYSLDSVVEDYLLNGTGADGEPLGILNTTGVQEQEYTAATPGAYDPEVNDDVMALVKAIRRAITKVTRLPGGTVTAVVLSPEDDEAIDLLQDQQDRFYGQGPFGSGPNTLWGRPRVTSERLTVGEPLLGDWRQVALLDREGLSVLAFNQHKDYAERNKTYVRAELRAAEVIWKPSRLVHVAPTPAP